MYTENHTSHSSHQATCPNRCTKLVLYTIPVFVDLALRNLQLCKTPLIASTIGVLQEVICRNTLGLRGLNLVSRLVKCPRGCFLRKVLPYMFTNSWSHLHGTGLFILRNCSCVNIILLLWGKFSSSNNFNIRRDWSLLLVFTRK